MDSIKKDFVKNLEALRNTLIKLVLCKVAKNTKNF